MVVLEYRSTRVPTYLETMSFSSATLAAALCSVATTAWRVCLSSSGSMAKCRSFQRATASSSSASWCAKHSTCADRGGPLTLSLSAMAVVVVVVDNEEDEDEDDDDDDNAEDVDEEEDDDDDGDDVAACCC